MGVSAAVQELRSKTESAFAENDTDLNSNSYTARHACRNVQFEPVAPRIPSDVNQNRQNAVSPGFAGVREGLLRFQHLATGLAGGGAGSLTANALFTLLKNGLGGGVSNQVGSDIDTGSGTTDADSINVTAGTWADGQIVRVGSIADGRANGAAAVIDDASGAPQLELLTALPGTPNDEDVVYATALVYPTETGQVSQAFINAFADTGKQWQCVGAYLNGLRLIMELGALPYWEFEYRFAYWDPEGDATPSTVALQTHDSAPFAGGGASLFFQTVGTTTRATLAARRVEIDLGLETRAHRTLGDGSGAQYRVIQGFTRLMCKPRVRITLMEHPGNTYQTLWDADGSDSTGKHILVQCNGTDGRAFGAHLPRCYMAGPRPTFEDVDGVLGQTFEMIGDEGPDTTSELTRSAVRFFMG